MNDVDIKAKQQIVEKIKTSTNILVIVSKNPTLDDLASAIGLTALLNKLGKHTTAIFSGTLPPAISFLDPTKVFESTVDSLRDFIIALDKEKADHLRYKIDGDSVKIFITPYRTTITNKDLEFSQGDYNVELILALGVSSKDNLDFALASHRQVLNDAPVMTFCAGRQTSDLGSVSWRDESASSLSEMIMSVSESLKTDKPLLDKQIATSLLTGIVSATQRFSNERTTSKVMTMAAQLMAAGADQQLISARLREDHEVNPKNTSLRKEENRSNQQAKVSDNPNLQIRKPENSAMSNPVVENKPVAQAPEIITPVKPVPAGTLMIDHEAAFETATPKQDVSMQYSNQSAANPINNIPQPTPVVASVPAPTSTPATVAAQLPKPEVLPSTPVVSTTSSFINKLASTVKPSVTTQNPVTEQTIPMPTGQIAGSKIDEAAISSHSYLNDSTTVGLSDQPDVFGLTPETTENVDIFNEAPMSTLPPITHDFELPMPPKLPDFNTLPPDGIANFNVPVSSDVPIPTNANTEPANPAQFKIPS